jgi:hypothetical protein
VILPFLIHRWAKLRAACNSNSLALWARATSMARLRAHSSSPPIVTCVSRRRSGVIWRRPTTPSGWSTPSGRPVDPPADYRDRFEALTGLSLRACPYCHTGIMVVIDCIAQPQVCQPAPEMEQQDTFEPIHLTKI